MVGDINEKVISLLKKGYLVSPDLLKNINEVSLPNTEEGSIEEMPAVLTKDVNDLLNKRPDFKLNWKDFEKARVGFEKGTDKNTYPSLLNLANYDKNKDKIEKIITEVKVPENPILTIEKNPVSSPVVLKNYIDKDQKLSVQSFIYHYRKRYYYLRDIF